MTDDASSESSYYESFSDSNESYIQDVISNVAEVLNNVSDVTQDDTSLVSEVEDVMSSQSENICAICLCDIEQNESYELDCGHCFHTSCIVRNLQSGNISCPNCRSLPEHISDVHNPYDIRADIIDDYNYDEQQRFFKKAVQLYRTGEAPKKLSDMVSKYIKTVDKNKEIKEINKGIKKQQCELQKKVKKTYTEESKEIIAIRKKYSNIRKNMRKDAKIKKERCDKTYVLQRMHREITEYLGWRPVRY